MLSCTSSNMSPLRQYPNAKMQPKLGAWGTKMDLVHLNCGVWLSHQSALWYWFEGFSLVGKTRGRLKWDDKHQTRIGRNEGIRHINPDSDL